MVGKPGLWVGALGRHLFLKQTWRTKPDNATRPGAHDGTRPTHRTGTEGQRPRPPTHPGHQETSARKRAHRRAGDPGSFHHFSFQLEGRDTGRTSAFSSLFLSRDGNHPSLKTATTRLRDTRPTPSHWAETATTRLRRRQPPVSEIPVQHPDTWQRRQPPASEIPDQLPTTWQGRQPLVSEDGNHPSPRYLTNSQPLGGDDNHPSPKTATTRLRDTRPTSNHLAETATTRLRRRQPPVSEIQFTKLRSTRYCEHSSGNHETRRGRS